MTNFTLERVIEQATAAGMNTQLREAVHYTYGRGMGRYLDTHPKGSEPENYRIVAAMAWGYLAARKTIKEYLQRPRDEDSTRNKEVRS